MVTLTGIIEELKFCVPSRRTLQRTNMLLAIGSLEAIDKKMRKRHPASCAGRVTRAS